ncbi:hypothetical protein GHT06_014225 [Daphnia sinensis]|uniref:GRIP domain-containing protein n=1 Tax=Daphnia sinensis TaxID=1820382 RepID=A0AAD5KTG3_9CRUS|nr:hypothetical protein GHT06_014225 [Daphnia sinensis]
MNCLYKTLVDIAEDSSETTPSAFSIADGDSRPSTPACATKEENFQPVNLNEPKREMNTSTPQPSGHIGRLSRQSSLSSVFSDVSFLPGSSDSAYHPYQFQSDLESNVSEFDDSASQSGQHALDRISKEHVYNAYQKMRVRYHKYKGRYSDLARHYKELERDREKVKHVLTETQDRSLRRISELKEQCVLEQQAKAHLEEILRSDLEEKDNLITVLQTKVVKLLASPSSSATEGPLIDLSNSESSKKSSDETDKDSKEGHVTEGEVQLLKEKLQRFESLLMKCKENIKHHIERNSELQAENEILKQTEAQKSEEAENIQKMHRDQLAQLTESLNMARTEIETLRRQEQEAALASAETKQKVHAELLEQEEKMVRLRSERDQLHNKVTQMESEIETIKEQTAKQLEETETIIEMEKQKLMKELSRGKTEALKLMEEDMTQRMENLKQERDVHWETIMQKRLSDEVENHARTLRQTEEHYRSRLAEMQEEKALALEEKELYCASLVSREQNNQQGLQDEIANLKREIEAKDKLVEKVREEGLEERRSWVKQIEDNRQRHLEELHSVNLQNEQLIEQQKEHHQNAIDTAILDLKQQHRKELDKLQQQHEELLQAANEDMESSAKNQIDQLRALLREKESEISHHNAAHQELQDALNNKDLNITDLTSQIDNLQDRLSAMDALTVQLNSALEKTKLLEPLNVELENTKGELVSRNSYVLQLEEQIQIIKKKAENDQAQASLLQQQLAESENKIEMLKAQVEDLNSIVKQNKEELALLDAVKLEVAELKDTLDEKEKSIIQLQAEVKEATASVDIKQCEWQKTVDELTNQHQMAQAELAAVRSLIDTKDDQMIQLQTAHDILVASESQLKSITQEKDLLIASRETELHTLKLALSDQENRVTQMLEERSQTEREKEETNQKLNTLEADLSTIRETKDQRIAELQEEIKQTECNLKAKETEWEEKVQESTYKMEETLSELLTLRTCLASKEEQILQLEQVRDKWVTEESSLKSAVEESESRLRASETELQRLKEIVDVKEQRITELQEELQQINQTLNAQDSELKKTNLELSDSLKTAQSELDDLKANLLQSNLRSNEWEQKTIELTDQLNTTRSELQEAKSSFETNANEIQKLEKVVNQMQSLIEEGKQQFLENETQLNATKQLLNDKETQIAELKTIHSTLECTTNESARQLDLLNHSLAVKESVIIDLQSEVERNGQVMSETNALIEEQRLQLEILKQSLADKENLAEQYKNQLASGETEWQLKLEAVNDQLNAVKRSEEESRVQLASKEDVLQEMELNYRNEMEKTSQQLADALVTTQSLEFELKKKVSELENVAARATELEMKLQLSTDQLVQKENEQETLKAENIKLNMELEHEKSKTGSLELMENQIKSLNNELSALSEEKNRLEILCKRFKVQLADTRKLLAATKTTEATASKDIQVVCPAKEVISEAKINNLMQAELNQNELKGHDTKELLQQQIANLQKELDIVRQQHQVEATELKRIIELGKASNAESSSSSNGVGSGFHGSLEEATELEYLRNIMFEYMMGRQPATLSKVVAAIVKFTPEQTRKIAEKEEQRQSLLGHLGLA